VALLGADYQLIDCIEPTAPEAAAPSSIILVPGCPAMIRSMSHPRRRRPRHINFIVLAGLSL